MCTDSMLWMKDTTIYESFRLSHEFALELTYPG